MCSLSRQGRVLACHGTSWKNAVGHHHNGWAHLQHLLLIGISVELLGHIAADQGRPAPRYSYREPNAYGPLIMCCHSQSQQMCCSLVWRQAVNQKVRVQRLLSAAHRARRDDRVRPYTLPLPRGRPMSAIVNGLASAFNGDKLREHLQANKGKSV